MPFCNPYALARTQAIWVGEGTGVGGDAEEGGAETGGHSGQQVSWISYWACSIRQRPASKAGGGE